LDASMVELPPPPSEKNPEVPERLDNLIMRCIQPEMERRPVDMRAVADSLESILAQLTAKRKLEQGEVDVEEDEEEASASAAEGGSAAPPSQSGAEEP
ncbi:MAG: hypothetical protein D6824_02795, partial [Planctomycetota bacterium]